MTDCIAADHSLEKSVSQQITGQVLPISAIGSDQIQSFIALSLIQRTLRSAKDEENNEQGHQDNVDETR